MDNKIRILCFTLFFCFTTSTQTNSLGPCLKGYIASNKMEDIPSFSIYYQGNHIKNDKDGFFTIQLEEGPKNTYFVLICKEVSPKFGSINTIESISVDSRKSLKFYNITKATYRSLESEIDSLEKKVKFYKNEYKKIEKRIALRKKFKGNIKKLAEEKEEILKKINYLKNKIHLYDDRMIAMQNETEKRAIGHFWIIKKVPVKEKSFVIPENCIVVQVNPKIVRGIENWNFSTSENFISLPRIVLKNNLELRNLPKKKSLVRSSHKSILNLDPFYKTSKWKEKQFEGKPNVIVSLP